MHDICFINHCFFWLHILLHLSLVFPASTSVHFVVVAVSRRVVVVTKLFSGVGRFPGSNQLRHLVPPHLVVKSLLTTHYIRAFSGHGRSRPNTEQALNKNTDSIRSSNQQQLSWSKCISTLFIFVSQYKWNVMTSRIFPKSHPTAFFISQRAI